MSDQICKSCRHYHPYEENAIAQSEDFGKGECHRYPPYVFFDSDDNSVIIWPELTDDDDCGEWAAVRGANPFAVRA